MSLDGNTLAFMQLRSRGHTSEGFLQSQFIGQNEELDAQRGLAMQALKETEGSSTGQARSLIGRIQAVNVLAPANEYANALEKRITDLEGFKEIGQGLLAEQESVLVSRKALQSELKSKLKNLETELKYGHHPVDDAIAGYGRRTSQGLGGYKEIPPPPYYHG